jgi:hypothetical protein
MAAIATTIRDLFPGAHDESADGTQIHQGHVHTKWTAMRVLKSYIGDWMLVLILWCVFLWLVPDPNISR